MTVFIFKEIYQQKIGRFHKFFMIGLSLQLIRIMNTKKLVINRLALEFNINKGFILISQFITLIIMNALIWLILKEVGFLVIRLNLSLGLKKKRNLDL